MVVESYYVPLKRAEIEVGKPLAWDVFDHNHKLLFKRGFVVERPSQLDTLLDKGLFKERVAGRAGQARAARDGDAAGDTAGSDEAGERSVQLDEIKLSIGDPFQIQTQVEQAESRYYVKLIGYLRGKSVLVTMPEVDGRLCYVRESQALIVRFFAGRNAYAFTANVLRSSSVPFPHMCLTYPAQVRGLVVRAGERVPVRIICAISAREDTRTVSAAGMLTNLSVSGALLSAKTRLGDKGDLISVKFRMTIRDIEVVTAIDASIRSLTQDDTGEFLHGIQFAGLPNDVAIALTAFVYQKLAETSR